MKKTLSTIPVGNFSVGNHLPLTLVAGPCVMESKKHLWTVATSLKKISQELGINFIFRCSYDKANRSSHLSYRGPDQDSALEMLGEVREKLGVPLLTDVHLPQDAKKVSKVADILQIPAFLCRQTDLILACAKTGKIVNIKKGQFLSPSEMGNAVQKVLACGNSKVMVTERGTSFGYHNLVVDMRGLGIMKKMGAPVLFDATHSVQLPGGQGKSSGGQREFVDLLARAAIAIGVAAVFLEVHPDPDRALSDGPNSIRLSDLKPLLKTLMALDKIAKKF